MKSLALYMSEHVSRVCFLISFAVAAKSVIAVLQLTGKYFSQTRAPR